MVKRVARRFCGDEGGEGGGRYCGGGGRGEGEFLRGNVDGLYLGVSKAVGAPPVWHR